MPDRETGKQRAVRIPLDYYKRPDRLQRWKSRLGGLALIAAVAWPVLGLVPGAGRAVQRSYSRGPVAAVHATWESDCNACHTPFTPIGGGGWAVHTLGVSPDGSARCRTCHAGPVHHAKELPRDLACASCHHDHRGREASLVRVADADCTQCHADLAPHYAGNSLKYQDRVDNFTTDHPDFKPAAGPDPGKLKFSHARHMAAGMLLPGGERGAFTLADIADPAERERYRRQQSDPKAPKSTPVQLQCASCHVTDAADLGLARRDLNGLPAAAVLPSRRNGDYMLPISYESNCKACHPLSFERKNPNDSRSGAVTVRHGLQPKEIKEFLEGHYTALALKGNAKVFQQFVPTRPLPGKLLSKEKATLLQAIQDKVERAQTQIFLGRQTCGECHHYEPAKEGVIPKRILAPHVPDVWFTHAVFNHAAHRAVKCLDCHAGATTSKRAADVLIPQRDICLNCHAPQTGSGDNRRGGARYDCVECHRYHHGDLTDQGGPLPGLGAGPRGVGEAGRLPLHKFLSPQGQ
jgi:predicted CXXCH cytochrome family protein